jgi:hypothetical protein
MRTFEEGSHGPVMITQCLLPYYAVLEERYRRRLPETLDDLAGPGHGTVQLPAHIAWSG